MEISFFSTKSFERNAFEKSNIDFHHGLHFFENHLSRETATLAQGSDAVCAFVSDVLDRQTMEILVQNGCLVVALRSAGFNHVDLRAAQALNLPVVRVPAYSPNAVAEHSIALILTLNRKIHKAYNRVREGNFSLDGLMGFDVSSRSVGIVGTGFIGSIVARIMLSFGCRVICHDIVPNLSLINLGAVYVSFEDLIAQSDIVSLHCPLSTATLHMIGTEQIKNMRTGVMLINTSRGGLIDTRAVIAGLKSGKIGYLGLDVYEEEEGLFFDNHSDQVINDDVFARLLTFPNVIITGHQAFLTQEAINAIARITLENLTAFENHKVQNLVSVAPKST